MHPSRRLSTILVVLVLFMTVLWGSPFVLSQGETQFRVRLAMSIPAPLQVVNDANISYLTPQGDWKTVDNAVITKDRNWTIQWDKPNNHLLLSSDAGDRIASANPIRLIPSDPEQAIKVNNRLYPGIIEIIPGKKGLEVYNIVDIESYVAGVLAGESIPGWHMEALKAQAVAARTFALCQRNRHGSFDFCDQTHCQRYIGMPQDPSFMAAVQSTNDEVLTYNNKLIHAFYHASSGGQTQNNDDIWGGEPLPYLRSVESYDTDSPSSIWPKSYLGSLGDLLNRLGMPGWKSCEIKGVISAQSHNLIAYAFRRSADGKTMTLTREDIRWKLGFPSPNFQIRRVSGEEIRQAISQMNGGTFKVIKGSAAGDQIHLSLQVDLNVPGEAINSPVTLDSSEIIFITGKGCGHGVGLSQWGSQNMALSGQDYQEILHHFYGNAVSIVPYASLVK